MRTKTSRERDTKTSPATNLNHRFLCGLLRSLSSRLRIFFSRGTAFFQFQFLPHICKFSHTFGGCFIHLKPNKKESCQLPEIIKFSHVDQVHPSSMRDILTDNNHQLSHMNTRRCQSHSVSYKGASHRKGSYAATKIPNFNVNVHCPSSMHKLWNSSRRDQNFS